MNSSGIDGNSQQNEVDIALRKAFLGLDEQDVQLLTELPCEIKESRERFVEALYAHLLAFDETRSFLCNEGLVERLKKKQMEYFDQLTSGKYDAEYVQSRFDVGVRHQQVGLRPEWYVGAFCRYLTWLLPEIAQRAPSKSLALSLAVIKVTLFDIGLATEAYFNADHEKLILLSKVFEDNIEGVFIANATGKILYSNKMASAISGFGNEMLSASYLHCLHQENQETLFTEATKYALENGRWQEELTFRRRNGEDYPAKVDIMSLCNSQGNTTHLIVEFTDITELKRKEAELAERTAELARSNHELEQFAYIASHDLQEPLRMVASYTQLIARRYRGKLDADADEFIQYAVDGALRMQLLINDLLALSRIGTKGKALVPTDSSNALERAISNLRVAIEESGATLTVGFLPVVMSEPSQLTQLFQNLVGNAIKFRGIHPPRIAIEAIERKKNEWLFSVKDNGIGIAPEFADRIFEIFQRLHSKEEYPGTGIGLALCKKIIERQGGRIWVESAFGEGSVFYFTLFKGEA